MRALVSAVALSLTVAQYAVAQSAPQERILIKAGITVVGADMERIAEQLAGSGARVEWYKDEAPSRKVSVAAFMIDRTEVANQRFKVMFEDHLFPPNLSNHPVVNVTWARADEFCKNEGGSLPTEEQWERAARGDDGRIYPWGNEFDREKAMFMGSTGVSRLKVGSFTLEKSGENLTGGTMPVDSRPQGASPFGVLNMSGNVWEWQDGWYDQNKKLRLLKGGSWLTPKASLRASTRLGDDGSRLYNDYGFRCVYPANK